MEQFREDIRHIRNMLETALHNLDRVEREVEPVIEELHELSQHEESRRLLDCSRFDPKRLETLLSYSRTESEQMATTFSRVFNSYLKPIQPQEVHDKKLFDEVMQVMPKVHHVLRIAAEMEQEVRQESIPS